MHTKGFQGNRLIEYSNGNLYSIQGVQCLMVSRNTIEDYSLICTLIVLLQVNESILRAEICEKETPGCGGESSKVSVPGILLLPANATEFEVTCSLQGFPEENLGGAMNTLAVFCVYLPLEHVRVRG